MSAGWPGPAIRACAPRTQASLAVSADGKRWTLLNASPDLRAQIQATPALHPQAASADSPIEAVVLTGAEIDQTAGLLSLRERSPFTLIATAATLAAVADNPMFGVLAPDVVSRRAITPGEHFALGGGLQAELFMVPGKLPLYLEGDNPDTAERERGQCRRRNHRRQQARLAYVPGAAAMTPALRERLSRADVDPVRRHAVHRRRDDPHRHRRRKPAAAWATCRSTARAARSRRSQAFRAEHLRAHQQHQSDPGRRLARAPPRRGRRLGGRLDGMEIVL